MAERLNCFQATQAEQSTVRNLDEITKRYVRTTEPAAQTGEPTRANGGGTTSTVSRELLGKDPSAEIDALIADEHARPGDDLRDLTLALGAEGATHAFLRFGRRLCTEGPHLNP
jgi:hypothetical protein